MAQSLGRTTRLLSTRLFSTTTVLPRPSPSPLPLSHLTSSLRSTSIPCQFYGPGNSPVKSFFQLENGEEEAKKKIYNVSNERYFGFGSLHNKQEVAKSFTYYRPMGGNPMIQQIPLHCASNVRFYSSSSSTTATSETQPKEKSYPTVFWHLHEGIEEIVADYVHHEVTRTWILVLFRLSLIIVAKDVFLSLVF